MISVLKQALNYLVLFCFLFQSLWPSVAFGMENPTLGPTKKFNRSLSSTSDLLSRKTKSTADSETFSRQDSFFSGRPQEGFRLPSLTLPLIDDKEEVFSNASPASFATPFDLKDLKNQDTFEKFCGANALYQELTRVEDEVGNLDALLWKAHGVKFALQRNGELSVTGDSGKEPSNSLRIFNPNGFIHLAENLKAQHLFAKAESVIHTGANSQIDRLDIWATGNEEQDGEFLNKGLSHLSSTHITLHEGHLNNQGEVKINPNGILNLKDHDLLNYGTVTLGKDASITKVDIFDNRTGGIIQGMRGQSYTLQGNRLENAGQILGIRILNFGSGVNQGLVKSKSLDLVIDDLFTNEAGSSLIPSGSFEIETAFSTSGQGVFQQNGVLDAKMLSINNRSFEDRSGKAHTYTDVTIGSNVESWILGKTQTDEDAKPSVWNATNTTFKGTHNADFLNEGVLNVRQKLTNQAFSFRNKGDITTRTLDQSRLTFDGSFINEEDGTIEVEGDASFRLDDLLNHGILLVKGKTKGHINRLFNDNSFILQGESRLTGKTLINNSIFRAKDVLEWKGDTVINSGTMTVFDNQIMARKQLINHYLFRWTHNAPRTWHLLNHGLMERTDQLESAHTPFTASIDKSTVFKKGKVENRGIINTAVSYKPRMTIKGGTFEHWNNSGNMTLSKLHLDAESFSNTGYIGVIGSVTGSTQTFLNKGIGVGKGEMVIGGSLSLNGDSFENTHKLQADQGIAYTGRTLINKGEMFTPKRAALNLTGSLTNTGHLQADKGFEIKAKLLDNQGKLLGTLGKQNSNIQADKIITSKDSLLYAHSLSIHAKEMEHQGKIKLNDNSSMRVGTLRNLGSIDKDKEASLYTRLDLMTDSLINEGVIGFGCLDILTGTIASTSNAKLIADLSLALSVRDIYAHYGLMSAKRLHFTSRAYKTSAFAKLINKGTIVSTDGTQIQSKFDNTSEGKADLGGLSLEEGINPSDPLINNGSLRLRNIQWLRSELKRIINGAARKNQNKTGYLEDSKAILLIEDSGHTLGVPEAMMGLRLGYGGFAFGKVINYGTIGFGNGTYNIRGLFENHGTHKVLKGQDLWYFDLLNAGEIYSDVPYTIDHTRGKVTKLGKVRAKDTFLLKLNDQEDAADVLHQNSILSEKGVTVETNKFTNYNPLTLPGSWTFKMKDMFHNYGKLTTGPLSVLGTSSGGGFRVGWYGPTLGELNVYGDLNVDVPWNIDSQWGVIKVLGNAKLTNAVSGGDIYVGHPVQSGQNKVANGAKITVTCGTLTLHGRNIITSFGALYGQKGVSLKAPWAIVNKSGKIYASDFITIEANELHNLIGDVYTVDGNTYNTRIAWRRHQQNHEFYMTETEKVHLVDSEPAEIKSNNGRILIKVNSGVNRGSFIQSPKAVFYHRVGNLTRPSSFLHEDQTLTTKLQEWRNGDEGPINCGIKTSNRVHQALIQSGEHVDINTGDLTITGSINAPTVTVNVTNILLQNTSGLDREAIPTVNIVINLADVAKQMASNPLFKNAFSQGQGMSMDGLLPKEGEKPLPLNLHDMLSLHNNQENSVPHALSPEVTRFSFMEALSQGLKQLYYNGKSGDDLLKEFYERGKEVDKDLQKAGQTLTPESFASFKKGFMFKSLQTIEGQLYTALNLLITPDMINRYGNGPATITGGEADGINLTATNNIAIQGGVVASKKDIKVIALQDLLVESLKARDGNTENYRERKIPAILDAYGKISTLSGRDTTTIAPETSSGYEGTENIAGRNINELSLSLEQKQTDLGKNYKRVETNVRQEVPKHTSKGTFKSVAGGYQRQQAPQVNAKKIIYKATGSIAFEEVHDTQTITEQRKQEKNSAFGKSTTKTQSSNFEARGRGGKFRSLEPMEVESEQGDITVIGITADTPKIIFKALEGSVLIALATNHSSSTWSEQKSDLFWKSMIQRMTKDKTYVQNRFTGTIEVLSKETIIEQVRGQTLEWMDRFQQEGGNINYILMEEIHKREEHKVEGPTAALAAVITLAAAMACPTVLAGAGPLVSAIASKVLASLASQAAVALVTAKGDIGRAAEALANKNTLKLLAMAGATAGLNDTIGVIPTQVAAGLINNQKPDEILKNVLIDQIARYAARSIGEAKLGYIPHKVAHMTAGGAMGAAMSKKAKDGFFSGAVGSLVAEVIADAVKENPKETGKRVAGRLEEKAKSGTMITEQDVNAAFRAEAKRTMDWSKLGAGVTLLLTQQNVDIGLNAATTALENNYSETLKAVACPEVLAVLSQAGVAGRLTAGALFLLQKIDQASDEYVEKLKRELDTIQEDVEGEDQGTQHDRKTTPPQHEPEKPEDKNEEKIHKNSLDYKGQTHVYKIQKGQDVQKYGESAQGMTKLGQSKRAEQQVRKLRKETGEQYESEIIRQFDNKKDARQFEHDLIKQTKNADPKALPLNKGLH